MKLLKQNTEKQLSSEIIILVNYRVRIVQKLVHDNTLSGIFMMQLLLKPERKDTFCKEEKNLYILTSSPAERFKVKLLQRKNFNQKLVDLNCDHICNFARHQNRIKFEV